MVMSGLQGKRWYFFVWDEDNEQHLLEHGIRYWEAEEAFFRSYVITPNNRGYGHHRYRLDGRSDSGRRLRIIFEDLGAGIARVITGWDL
jgi:uncharacterized DUF497 family protein